MYVAVAAKVAHEYWACFFSSFRKAKQSVLYLCMANICLYGVFVTRESLCEQTIKMYAFYFFILTQKISLLTMN